MSNKNVKLTLSLQYSGVDDETVNAPAQVLNCPYAAGAQMVGGIDVTAGTDGSVTPVVFDVPFGGIAQATLMILENRTSQSMELKVNGQNPVGNHHDIPPGGFFVLGGSTVAAHPLTAVSLTLASLCAGAGSVAFKLFGDPV